MFIKPNVEKIKNAGQIDKLVKLLRHRRSLTRIEALDALYEIAGIDEKVIEKMRRSLTDKRSNVRNRASLIFARMSDTSVLDNLADIVSRGTVNEQIEVLRLLPHYYTSENEKITQILAVGLKDKKTYSIR